MIDFEAFKIILVIDKVQGNGTDYIKITNITEYENKIIVQVTKNIFQFGTAIIAQSFQIVKIPISSKPIEFQQIQN